MKLASVTITNNTATGAHNASDGNGSFGGRRDERHERHRGMPSGRPIRQCSRFGTMVDVFESSESMFS
jgi:hypothetical protein